MTRRITIIQGHPDPAGGHLCHALADAYAAGAQATGHEVRRIEVAGLDFPLLRSQSQFALSPPPPDIEAAQEAIAWAQHLVIVYPLWLGTMPALLKGFFEQTLREGYAVRFESNGRWTRLLKDRSARIVVTMSIPTLAFRWLFGAHGLKMLERSILRFVGIAPLRESLFGMVDSADEAKRRGWLEKMRKLGAKAL